MNTNLFHLLKLMTMQYCPTGWVKWQLKRLKVFGLAAQMMLKKEFGCVEDSLLDSPTGKTTARERIKNVPMEYTTSRHLVFTSISLRGKNPCLKKTIGPKSDNL